MDTCVALYDYAATAEGDLTFSAGDRIELITKTDSAEDWWVGRVIGGGAGNGNTGYGNTGEEGTEGNFPANYVRLV